MQKVLNRMTRAEAAAYIGCSPSTFNRLLRDGFLSNTYYSVMGRRFFITEKLDKWIDAGGCEQFKEKE